MPHGSTRPASPRARRLASMNSDFRGAPSRDSSAIWGMSHTHLTRGVEPTFCGGHTLTPADIPALRDRPRLARPGLALRSPTERVERQDPRAPAARAGRAAGGRPQRQARWGTCPPLWVFPAALPLPPPPPPTACRRYTFMIPEVMTRSLSLPRTHLPVSRGRTNVCL